MQNTAGGLLAWQRPRGWLMTPLPWSLLGHQGTSWWSHLLACGAGFPKSFQRVHSGGLLQASLVTSLFKYPVPEPGSSPPHIPSCEPTFHATPDDGKSEGVVGTPKDWSIGETQSCSQSDIHSMEGQDFVQRSFFFHVNPRVCFLFPVTACPQKGRA